MNTNDIFWLLPLGVCLAIGALAQGWKGRTGAAWGLLSVLPMAAIWMLTAMAVDPPFHQRAVWPLALVITASLLGGGIMALIVATLPRVGVPSEADQVGAYRKCPSCAVAIRVEAVKCRYCQSEVTPMAANE